ncbi:MAG: hypothetical protein PUP90_03580 [Nostoc sp. S4]|nr:hypothetical protein [Nostoc sp. S4]
MVHRKAISRLADSNLRKSPCITTISSLLMAIVSVVFWAANLANKRVIVAPASLQRRMQPTL